MTLLLSCSIFYVTQQKVNNFLMAKYYPIWNPYFKIFQCTRKKQYSCWLYLWVTAFVCEILHPRTLTVMTWFHIIMMHFNYILTSISYLAPLLPPLNSPIFPSSLTSTVLALVTCHGVLIVPLLYIWVSL